MKPTFNWLRAPQPHAYAKTRVADSIRRPYDDSNDDSHFRRCDTPKDVIREPSGNIVAWRA